MDHELRNQLLELVKIYSDFKGIVIDMGGIYPSTLELEIARGQARLPTKAQSAILQEDLEFRNLPLKTLASRLEYGPPFQLSDIKDIKSISNLPVVIKGIMCAEDALLALENGADAIWISNCGGKLLDT